MPEKTSVDVDAVEEPEGVLEPEELTVEDSEHIDSLDSNRYVVTGDSEPVELSEEFKRQQTAGTEVAEDEGFVEQVSEPFAVEMIVKTTHGVDEMQLKGQDITSVFEAVARWYANQLEPELQPETVLELVMNESELELDVERSIDSLLRVNAEES